MRIPIRRRAAPRSHAQNSTSWLLTFASLAFLSRAFTVTSVNSPDLDLSQLGRVGIAGDFAGLSLYEFEGQTESPFTRNGSETLMTQLPNGVVAKILSSDASIQTMCTFDGAVILGGNFTSLDGTNSAGIAQYNLTTSEITPLTGPSGQNLTGQVNSLLCDDDAGLVYVGGSFKAGDSNNAITWVRSGSWASLPFAGFNGPVTSIIKTSNGHVIFGGSFDGLGNSTTPTEADGQVINLSTATIDADQSTTAAGFSDPSNIVCKTGGIDGAGSTWLLKDNTAGAWRAKFKFGFEPTKLRLWNTHQDGRGTKTWRFTALPINGIMNFTFTDPATNQNAACTSECPLSDNSSLPYQDFHFVNRVGMNEFRIDVSAWYGSGSGLDGIELFEDDIFAYAINDFNEPSCANLEFPSTAISTGPWSVTPSGQSSSQYLSANLSSPIKSDAAKVTFYADIREDGNYSVVLFTPGCIQDDSCENRGQVTVSWNLTSGGQTGSTTLYQTNNYDKYDLLTTGIVDASSADFRPSISIAPLADQSLSTMTMVAQKVGYTLISSTGGLGGLFEYDPSKKTVDTSDFTTSTFDKLGSDFSRQSAVLSMTTIGDVTYIGGNFTSSTVRNVVAVNSNDNSIVALDGGLNGQVRSMYAFGDQLFVGGSFNNTQDGSATGLSYVAVYDTRTNKWSPLGAGVDASVMNVVPMTLNISSSTPEDVITFTGEFKKLLAFGSNEEVTVDGFAVWVKSQSNWLQNLDGPLPSLTGILSSALLNTSDGSSLYSGSISSQALSANGAATISDSLGTFPVTILPQSASVTNNSGSGITRRASLTNSTSTISGVVAGAFHETDDTNITVLAGHFTAHASNGSTINNLVLIDGGNDDAVTGLPFGISDEAVFLALAIQGNTLFVGGQLNGTVGSTSVNGLLSYSLTDKAFKTQPPALTGAQGVVSSIAVRPESSDVYVGGSFDNAGSLGCPGVCVFSTSLSQWNRPGVGLDGDVKSMLWSSKSTLIVGGNLAVNDTTAFLASYDADKSIWSEFSSASSLPGPVDALTAASSDVSQLWVAGTQTNGSVYLMKYDGSSWQSTGVTLGADTVISSLQVFTTKSSHDSNNLLDSNQVLLITGSLDLQGFGTASSATFNGTTLQPYVLTDKANSAGSIAKIFVQKQNFFTSSDGHLALGFVVLIALAISLGLMLLIVVAGLALDRYRKKRDGYVPAPTSMMDRGSGMQRIPPGELLDSLNKGRPAAPHV